jgi:hypothetical protein
LPRSFAAYFRFLVALACCWPDPATAQPVPDAKPQLIVTSPADGSVWGQDVRVVASCVDDGPSCTITVSEASSELATGIGSIDTIVKPFYPRAFVWIEAKDSAGQKVSEQRTVYTLDRKLTLAATYSETILDIDKDRVLVADYAQATANFRIIDRATNTQQTIWATSDGTSSPQYGYLTPAGAIFVVSGPDYRLLEWRNGAIVDLGTIVIYHSNYYGTDDSLVVKGGWALYMSAASGCCPRVGTLTLRNLTTGTNTTAGLLEISNYGTLSPDIAPDGRAVYTTPRTSPTDVEIVAFDAGPPAAETLLTNHALRSFWPRTDGINVVFTRAPDTDGPHSTVLRKSDGTEIVLASDVYHAAPDTGYRVAGGWVAFVRDTVDDRREGWLRAPDGTERRLPLTERHFPSLEALNERGDVVYTISADERVLSRADGTTVQFSRMGTPVWLNDEWYVRSGEHLFAIAAAPERAILSEGATGTFFSTDIAILNPHAHAVPATIRYLRENAPEIQETRTLAPLSRTTIHAADVPGLDGASVSTTIDSPEGSPLVVDRLMTWDAGGYGGHLGSAVKEPRPRWLFAEGAQGYFNTFFLLANSGGEEATVRVTFLLEQGAPIVHTTTVGPGARKTVYAGDIPGLANQSFATLIDSDRSIVAERAMYFGGAPFWRGGHGSPGVPEPEREWFHAEGATGQFFDTYILLANPHDTEVDVNLRYITDAGVVVQRKRTLAPRSRQTFNLVNEAPELANASVSTRIDSYPLPIVSERAMYWGWELPGGWLDAHNSFGMTATATRWGLAEGRAGGPRNYRTYVLVSNNSSSTAQLRLVFIREDGVRVERLREVGNGQRLTIDTSVIPELANSNFSTIVESTNNISIAVESSIYWDTGGVFMESGGNTVATRLW